MQPLKELLVSGQNLAAIALAERFAHSPMQDISLGIEVSLVLLHPGSQCVLDRLDLGSVPSDPHLLSYPVSEMVFQRDVQPYLPGCRQ